MLKIAGLFGMVAALGLLGMLKSSELKLRVALLQDFLQMILTLKSKIDYLHEPLQSVLKDESGGAERKALQLLTGVQRDLETRQADTLQRAWDENVRSTYRGTPLSARDLELLRYPGMFLGQTDCENQAQQFAYLVTCLQAQIREAEGQYRSKGPLYRKVGFFGGTLLAVVLL